jgi:D-serine deaminase-like pyridoxal phosphate-dependent protein
VNGQPVTWTTVRPGTYVTLTNGQLVELRDGRYAIVQSPGAVVTPAPSTTVITPAPGTTTVVTQAPATTGVRQTIYGRITDVDRNEVRIKTEHGTFEMPIANPASSGIRKGDTVQLDVIISPTSPSALPRR